MLPTPEPHSIAYSIYSLKWGIKTSRNADCAKAQKSPPQLLRGDVPFTVELFFQRRDSRIYGSISVPTSEHWFWSGSDLSVLRPERWFWFSSDLSVPRPERGFWFVSDLSLSPDQITGSGAEPWVVVPVRTGRCRSAQAPCWEAPAGWTGRHADRLMGSGGFSGRPALQGRCLADADMSLDRK